MTVKLANLAVTLISMCFGCRKGLLLEIVISLGIRKKIRRPAVTAHSVTAINTYKVLKQKTIHYNIFEKHFNLNINSWQLNSISHISEQK